MKNYLAALHIYEDVSGKRSSSYVSTLANLGGLNCWPLHAAHQPQFMSKRYLLYCFSSLLCLLAVYFVCSLLLQYSFSSIFWHLSPITAEVNTTTSTFSPSSYLNYIWMLLPVLTNFCNFLFIMILIGVLYKTLAEISENEEKADLLMKAEEALQDAYTLRSEMTGNEYKKRIWLKGERMLME